MNNTSYTKNILIYYVDVLSSIPYNSIFKPTIDANTLINSKYCNSFIKFTFFFQITFRKHLESVGNLYIPAPYNNSNASVKIEFAKLLHPHYFPNFPIPTVS
jgi:hypothetical protein